MKRPAARGAFEYRAGRLHCEEVALDALAERYGTPLYVYSRAAIESAFDSYAAALDGRASLICYAMKANSNLAVLDLLARRGAGFDIVSGGELARALAAGASAGKVVFSGVGKTAVEIEAALRAGILCFNVESQAELHCIAAVANDCGQRARISLRVNPDVDARTHPYISTGLKANKFGVAHADALTLYREAAQLTAIEVVGIDCHIGSQITELGPYLDAAERILDIVDSLQAEGIRLRHLDFGGGLGIRYRAEQPPAPAQLVRALIERVDRRGHADKTLMLEPGRSIVGAAGALLTRTLYVKPGEARNFAIVDAAMNDLARPAMYDAWMSVQPVAQTSSAGVALYDIVGPVCESADWLARERELAIGAGELLAIGDAGAYAMAMSSNYNSRPRAAEVIVDGNCTYCVRERESVEALYRGESRLP